MATVFILTLEEEKHAHKHRETHNADGFDYKLSCATVLAWNHTLTYTAGVCVTTPSWQEKPRDWWSTNRWECDKERRGFWRPPPPVTNPQSFAHLTFVPCSPSVTLTNWRSLLITKHLLTSGLCIVFTSVVKHSTSITTTNLTLWRIAAMPTSRWCTEKTCCQTTWRALTRVNMFPYSVRHYPLATIVVKVGF